MFNRFISLESEYNILNKKFDDDKVDVENQFQKVSLPITKQD